LAEPPRFTLRRASEQDATAIRDLIHQVGINPMGLDWRRFQVAIDGQGRLIGCGQIKPHGTEILELASIAVDAGWRGRGVARAIIQSLMAEAPRPLYLMCRSGLEAFYVKFGFRALDAAELPPYFRRMKALIGVYERLANAEETVLIMKLQ
jgi:amino-acid N-acetyltransferase